MLIFYKTILQLLMIFWHSLWGYLFWESLQETNFDASIMYYRLSFCLEVLSILLLVFTFFTKKKKDYYHLILPILLHLPLTYYNIPRNGTYYDPMVGENILVSYSWEFDIINGCVLLLFYYLLSVKINGKSVWSTLC